MKRYLLLITILINLFTLTSCNNEEDNNNNQLIHDSWHISKNLVQCYTQLDSIKVEVLSPGDKLIPALFDIEFLGVSSDYLDDSIKFINKSKYYGDTCFYQNVYTDQYCALDDSINGIDIYCDRNFDVQHPQGTSLSNIAYLYFDSFYERISKGYMVIPRTEYKYSDITMDYQYEIACDNICWDNTKLISTIEESVLFIKGIPSNPGRYTFTFVFHFSQRDIKASCSTEFE